MRISDWSSDGALPISNTFNATAISQADYHLQHLVHELNAEGARIARECCDAAGEKTPGKPRFVIGVLGPTSRTASISPDVNDQIGRASGRERVCPYV